MSDNVQGGHEVMALNTGLLLSTSKVTKLPITDAVVKAVENLAYSQGFKSLNSRIAEVNPFMMYL